MGARALHGVALDERYALKACGVWDTAEIDAFCGRLASAAVVAIDAPAALSTRPHRGDPTLARKFQAGRCAEVALGRAGYWVSFVSPVDSAPPWMQVGFDLFAAARARVTHEVIEVYPYACFRELAGGAALPKKTTPAGAARRADLLQQVGVDAADLESWSHHALDAAAAAVTAVQRNAGTAIEARCDPADGHEHDGSSIWLPARPQPPRVG